MMSKKQSFLQIFFPYYIYFLIFLNLMQISGKMQGPDKRQQTVGGGRNGRFLEDDEENGRKTPTAMDEPQRQLHFILAIELQDFMMCKRCKTKRLVGFQFKV